jgi:ribonuclease BN (tRNA processing enzyme)
MQRFGIPWPRLTHLCITHFHTDHVGGIPILLFALKHALGEPRHEPLAVVGPHGTRRFLERLASAFGDYVLEPGFPVLVHEIAPTAQLELPGDIRLRAHATPHTAESVAFRLDRGSAALGYTGDTGPDPEGLGRFFQGVDTLIAECSLPDDQAIDMHLTPSHLARLAMAAGPRRVVATHVYPPLHGVDVPALIRGAGWTGVVVMASDGLRLEVGGPGAG